jgi:hypothetical protein
MIRISKRGLKPDEFNFNEGLPLRSGRNGSRSDLPFTNQATDEILQNFQLISSSSLVLQRWQIYTNIAPLWG